VIETVSYNGLDTEVYDLRPGDYTTSLLVLLLHKTSQCSYGIAGSRIPS